MSKVTQTLTRKINLIRSMESEAEILIFGLLNQLRPAIFASLDYRSLAKSKNRFEFISRSMCEYFFYDSFYLFDKVKSKPTHPEAPNGHNALTVQIENHHHQWGFSGFEFLGMDANDSLAVLQFNSIDLQRLLIDEFGEFPIIQIRFCISDISEKYYDELDPYISPLHTLDLSHIERVEPIWSQWISRSKRWIGGHSRLPALQGGADD